MVYSAEQSELYLRNLKEEMADSAPAKTNIEAKIDSCIQLRNEANKKIKESDTANIGKALSIYARSDQIIKTLQLRICDNPVKSHSIGSSYPC